MGWTLVITPDQLAGRTEHSQQVALFAQAALHIYKYPQLKWLFAIPNANSHKMVSEGVRAGVPDICLPYPKWTYRLPSVDNPTGKYMMYLAGLYIELKIESRRTEKNGGCSQDQLEYLDYLNDAGYKAVVCYGWQDAWRVIEEYLNG